jgi:hypothetical protein
MSEKPEDSSSIPFVDDNNDVVLGSKNLDDKQHDL